MRAFDHLLLLCVCGLHDQDLSVLRVSLEAGANQWGVEGRSSPQCHAVLPGGRPLLLATFDVSRCVHGCVYLCVCVCVRDCVCVYLWLLVC